MSCNPELPTGLRRRSKGFTIWSTTSTTWTNSTMRCLSTGPRILGRACFFRGLKVCRRRGQLARLQRRAEPRPFPSYFDKYVVDGLVNLVGWINMGLNRIATSFQTGLVQRYALVAVLGIVVFILIYYNGLLMPILETVAAFRQFEIGLTRMSNLESMRSWIRWTFS